jgi:transposase
MPYIQGENRDQLTLTPMCLDDYIDADSICRVIAAYVGTLDMVALGFKYAKTKDTGRPPYAPANMLMLYLYGYLNRIRSSRRLNAETKRNVEVMWLLEKLTPDDKTISNFRKDNAVALRKVFREFSLWCSRQGLYGKELIAVDGSKIRANSSRKNIHTPKGTEKDLASVDKKISEYMNALESNDAAEQSDPALSPEAIHEALKRLNEKKDKFNGWLKRIEENDGCEISTVDPDAHFMHQGGDGRSLDACYNVQSVVDGKHKLVVDFDVSTCPDDKGALPKMTESAKEIMGVEKITVVADKGYYDGDDLKECEQNGTTCYVPKMQNGKLAPDSKYDHKNFRYDKDTDSYICPEGAVLVFQRVRKRPKGRTDRLYFNFDACQKCEFRKNCWKNKSRRGREIFRSPNQDTLDIVDARMSSDEAREISRERKKIVEHPFGTVKKIWGYSQFLCRGQEKTTAEQSLAFWAYNFRRVINIFKEDGKSLLEALA